MPTTQKPGPWRMMQAEADRLHWPHLYRKDLERDESRISCSSANAPFVWGISATGTHLIYPFPWEMLPDSERLAHERMTEAGKIRPASHFIGAVDRGFGPHRWYAWDGVSLRHMDAVGAMMFADRIEKPEPAELS